ncbi:MAG: ECF transporter S component [bacterium]
MNAQSTVLQDLALAADHLRREGFGFVVTRRGQVVFESADPGLGALLRAARKLRQAEAQDVVLADRVVGLAALLVACWAGIRAVHAEVASEAAHREADARGVFLQSVRRVPQVLNRSGDGPCPFEAAVHAALRRGASLPDVVRLLEQMTSGVGVAAPACQHGAAGPQVLAGTGLGLALAILLPVFFHLFGLGPTFLPMHLPALLVGALFGPGAGFLVGTVAPVASGLLTGMPPLVPVGVLMTAELATYGAVAGWVRLALADRYRGSTAHPLIREYAWLLSALLAGRVILGLWAAVLGPLVGLRVPATTYVAAAVASGLPGIAVQLVLVPLLAWKLADLLNTKPERGDRDGTPDAS